MSTPYHLFECTGVELEYMIVDRQSLDIRPIADVLLADVAGAGASDVEWGVTAWSNELVLHVIELKTNGPAPSLRGLAQRFQADVDRINRVLMRHGACLMPTSMHPWMTPERETRLWPHEYNDVYRAFDRVFDCRGHGWSNVQSTHLNLPFANNEEFARLHAAIRILLPILPALAASSPLADGRLSGLADTRMEFYRHNARRIPSVAGDIVPEPVFSIDEYHDVILKQIYRDIEPHDSAGVLRHEWLNARGAIARFDRNAIEIRILDIQECPRADIAILTLIVTTLRNLVEERWCSLDMQSAWPVAPLREILLRCIRDAEAAPLDNADYVRLFGGTSHTVRTAGQLWRHVVSVCRGAFDDDVAAIVDTLVEHGPLARRMTAALPESPDRAALMGLYRRLCQCLAEDTLFTPQLRGAVAG